MTDPRGARSGDDLDTLLRDAGREPTIDLDVDDVHTRGRRRAVGRRVAAGAGALALAGVVAVGLTSLLDQPDTPIVDQAPSDGTPGVGTEQARLRELLGLDAGPGSSTALNLAPAAVAAAVDVDLVDAVWQPATDGFSVTRTGPAGATTLSSVTTGTILSGPEVSADGALWWTGTDDGVHRADPVTGEVTELLAAPDPFAWIVVGVATDSPEAVVSLVGPPGEPAPDGRPRVATLHPDGELTALPVTGIDELSSEGLVMDAHVTDSHVALMVAQDTSDGRVLEVHHGPLGGPLVQVYEGTARTEEPGSSYLGGVTVVGDEVWVVDAAEPPTAGQSSEVRLTNVLRFPTDTDRSSATSSFGIPAPLMDGAIVTGLHAAPNGRVALVQLIDRSSDDQQTLALFPGALPLVDDPGSTVRIVDADGLLAVASATGGATGAESPAAGPEGEVAATAACATDQDAPLNAPPSGFGGEVWWLCWDATDQLHDGAAHPFAATEMFSGGNGETSEPGIPERAAHGAPRLVGV